MPKKKRKKYSRFNPAYLASRHAGTLFMFLALGLLCGVAYRALVQPTRYAAYTEVSVKVVPPEAALSFDWDAKQREWNGWLHNRRDWGLLCANLRLAVKLAATQDADLDTGLLDSKLAAFDPQAAFSASLFSNHSLGRFGLVIDVTRRDLASYIDFQSLATIIADLDPPREGAVKWDFSFFHARSPEQADSGVIAKPGPDDRYFKVFHHLYESLRGQPTDSPLVAWRAAVNELASRLDREAKFSGGGGLGATAKREIIREIMAIPVLAANGLYHVNGWFMADMEPGERAAAWADHWGRDSAINLRAMSASGGRVAASMAMDLNPIAFRRDTAYTRLPPLAVATLVSFIAAREDRGEPAPFEDTIAQIVHDPEPEADFVAELEPLEETTETVEVTYKEVIDEVAAKHRLSLIAMHEESVNMARVQRDAAFRRLNAARDAENRLSVEAVAARTRADRLQERYDAAVIATETDDKPKVPPETARLFAQRDEVFARLTTLLQYCTEEHPFVRQARRELDALEAQLAHHNPDAEANRAAEARATRVANLYLEWETAAEQADTLEERRRRQSEESACLLDEVTELERCISQRELELAKAKESPVPIIRQEIPVTRRVRSVVAPKVVAPKVVPPVVKPVQAQPAAIMRTHLEFDPLPVRIPLEKTPPDRRALFLGALCGLCLGILWALLRELFARRFRNAAEAKRMVRLPVLATLPAYDMRSLRAAAGTMKGELLRTRAGKVQFVPNLVEYSEPPPEARRGKIVPAARKPRFLAWVFALLLLLLAGMLHYRSYTGFAQPGESGPIAELPLPGATIPAWLEEGEEWGNLP